MRPFNHGCFQHAAKTSWCTALAVFKAAMLFEWTGTCALLIIQFTIELMTCCKGCQSVPQLFPSCVVFMTKRNGFQITNKEMQRLMTATTAEPWSNHVPCRKNTLVIAGTGRCCKAWNWVPDVPRHCDSLTQPSWPWCHQCHEFESVCTAILPLGASFWKWLWCQSCICDQLVQFSLPCCFVWSVALFAVTDALPIGFGLSATKGTFGNHHRRKERMDMPLQERMRHWHNVRWVELVKHLSQNQWKKTSQQIWSMDSADSRHSKMESVFQIAKAQWKCAKQTGTENPMITMETRATIGSARSQDHHLNNAQWFLGPNGRCSVVRTRQLGPSWAKMQSWRHWIHLTKTRGATATLKSQSTTMKSSLTIKRGAKVRRVTLQHDGKPICFCPGARFLQAHHHSTCQFEVGYETSTMHNPFFCGKTSRLLKGRLAQHHDIMSDKLLADINVRQLSQKGASHFVVQFSTCFAPIACQTFDTSLHLFFGVEGHIKGSPTLLHFLCMLPKCKGQVAPSGAIWGWSVFQT